jgi:Cu+-exporting ATPase
MTKDPVCGMTIEPAKAAGQMVHAGNTYYFCSAKCQQTFQENPRKYAAPPSTCGAGHGCH